MAQNSKNVGGIDKSTAIGLAAATAAAAAAAGAYWFYGSADGSKRRKQVKSFVFKARADVLDAVEKLKDIDKSSYLGIVDKVVSKYSSVAGVTADEVAQMSRDLKTAWTHMKAVHDTVNPAHKKVAAKKVPAKKKAPAKKKSE